MKLFIRLGEAIGGRSGFETIDEYIKVINEHGAAWFGADLISTGFGKEKQEEMRAYLNNNSSIEICFIVSKNGGGDNQISYIAEFTEFISNAVHSYCPDGKLEPKAFKDNPALIWLKLISIVDESKLKTSDFYIKSTGMRLDKLLAKSQNPFGYIEKYNYPVKHHYWIIEAAGILTKTLDKSCFRYNGSGLPKELMEFFPIEDITHGNNIILNAMYEGKQTKLRFTVDELDRVRVYWGKEVSEALEKQFNKLKRELENDTEVSDDAYISFEIDDDNNIEVTLKKLLKEEIDNIEVDEDLSNLKGLVEGTKKTIQVNAYERNPKARRRCLEIHGYKCSVCGMDFEKVYGELGKNFIHVHHVVDISTIGKEYEVNPAVDLKPVCPNCHSMLHREKPAISIDKLNQIMLFDDF